jgi:restriction system protein
MGAIWGSREYFIDALTEIAGYKAGVVLTDVELIDIMQDQEDVARILDPLGPGGGRIHSSTFSDAVVTLLYRLGNTPEDSNIPITAQLFHKYRNTDREAIYRNLMEAWLAFMEIELANPKKRALDPSKLILSMMKMHGMVGV